MKIDVVMSCGPKAEQYVPYVIQNLLSTAVEHDLRFILPTHRCNLDFLKNHPNVKTIIELPDDIPDSQHSASHAHARSVNAAAKLIDTELAMIMDYDIAFLTRGWDVWMVDRFNDPTVGIVGTEYVDTMRGARKYLDYPTVIMNMIRSHLLSDYKIDFNPKHNQIRISTPAESLAYGRPIGQTVQPDSGYELASKLRPAGVKCVTLKYIHEGGALSIGQNFCTEGVLANHMKSGSIQTSDTISLWKRSIDDYLENNK